MAEQLKLDEAIQRYVTPGAFVALEGFTHLIPFAAGHEIIRQGIRDLTLLRLTPDIIYDQLIGVGAARKLIFSWLGNPGVGSLYRIRDAIENDYPAALELDERSHSAMTAAYTAGAARLPMGIYRGYAGDLQQHSPIATVTCPFSGEQVLASPAVNPDVTIIHAQQADARGNVLIRGILGVQREIALAAEKLLVTVEEVVEELPSEPNDCVLPHWVVSAVCRVPQGAYPSYAHGFYGRDNDFYRGWTAISKSRERFQEWIDRHVTSTNNHTEFLASLGKQGVVAMPKGGA